MAELSREVLIDSINKEGRIPFDYIWEFYQENGGFIKDPQQFMSLFNKFTLASAPDFKRLYAKYEVNVIVDKQGDFVNVY